MAASGHLGVGWEAPGPHESVLWGHSSNRCRRKQSFLDSFFSDSQIRIASCWQSQGSQLAGEGLLPVAVAGGSLSLGLGE